MAKRKRSDRDELPVDVGLGATLAHLRGEPLPEPATHAADDSTEGDWTVVGPSKRRKAKTNNNGTDDYPLSSTSSAHSQRGQPDGRESPSDDIWATNRSRSGPSNEDQTREERRKERKLQRNYPAIEHSHHARLQSHVKLADLQSLVLYLLADGNAPQWVSVRSRNSIQKVVMLMVPGLELGMFNGTVSLESDSGNVQSDTAAPTPDSAQSKRLTISPDDFYPASLRPDRLPACLRPLSEIFEHVWPIKAPGEHRNNQYIKVHSPIHTMLSSQIPKTQEEKRMKKSGAHKGPMPPNAKDWVDKRTPITDYLATLVEQQENEYVLHPALFATPEAKEAALQQRQVAKQTSEYGWVDTLVASLDDGNVAEDEIEQGSITAGRHILSIDCEMCKAEDDRLVLTRISLLNWDGTVAMDKLVKPDVVIKDYLTQWSGITAAMLQDVTTTLSDIQKELLQLVTPRTILVGHSLNSDLNAMKLTHPFLIDTGLLYPHPRGPPYKQSLKWLAQKYLKREVQKGSSGHDSVEDARTCLDLVKQKCEKGPRWGSGDTNAESIFKRLERTVRPNSNAMHRCGAVVIGGVQNEAMVGKHGLPWHARRTMRLWMPLTVRCKGKQATKRVRLTVWISSGGGCVSWSCPGAGGTMRERRMWKRFDRGRCNDWALRQRMRRRTVKPKGPGSAMPSLKRSGALGKSTTLCHAALRSSCTAGPTIHERFVACKPCNSSTGENTRRRIGTASASNGPTRRYRHCRGPVRTPATALA